MKLYKMSFKKSYLVNNVRQIIPINDDITNFELEYKLYSSDGNFTAVIVSQEQLDMNKIPSPRVIEKGAVLSGGVKSDDNQKTIYYLILQSDTPCNVVFEYIRHEIAQQQPPQPQVKIEGSGNFFQDYKILTGVGIVSVVSVLLYLILQDTKKPAYRPTQPVFPSQRPPMFPAQRPPVFPAQRPPMFPAQRPLYRPEFKRSVSESSESEESSEPSRKRREVKQRSESESERSEHSRRRNKHRETRHKRRSESESESERSKRDNKRESERSRSIESVESKHSLETKNDRGRQDHHHHKQEMNLKRKEDTHKKNDNKA